MSAGKRNSGDASNEFAAFVSDASVTESLVPILAERGWPLDCVSTGGIEMAIRILGAAPSPQVLVVDITNSPDPRGDINALAEVCEPGTSVIAIGDQNDVSLYRSLIETGILDYFAKPVSPDEMRYAIEHAEHLLRAPEDGGPGGENSSQRMVTVLGCRGGVGSSLLASSCAWIMANQLGRSVALLDLDIHFGTGALTFDLEPGRGLVDALDNPSRVDSLFIERAVIKESDKLSILSAEASLSDATHPDPASLSHLIGEVKRNYQVSMVDLPRHTAAQYPFILSESTDVVLVTDMTLAATRDTIRLLSFVKEMASHASVRIVANRLGSNGLIEVEQKDFESSIERKVDWTIPNDMKSVIMAAKRGKPLPEAMPSSKLVQSLHSLSESIVGGAEKSTDESFWKRMVVRKK